MKTITEHERELIKSIVDAMRELSECTGHKNIECEYESPHIRDKYDKDTDVLAELAKVECFTMLEDERRYIKLYSLDRKEYMI